MLSGDNGILQRATDAKSQTGVGQEKETIALAYNSALAKKVGNGNSSAITDSELNDELDRSEASASGSPIIVTFTKTGNAYEIDSNGVIKPSIPKDPNAQMTIAEAKANETVFDNKTTLIDDYNNEIIVPKGFKISDVSGTNIKVGIVIDDGIGNQYVWIPVSNINHDGSNKIKVNSADEEGVEITLGRYTFATSSPGNPTLTDGKYQYANSYNTPVGLAGTPTTVPESTRFCRELTTYQISNGLGDTTGTNTTARGKKQADNSYNGIQGFIESVEANKGYYIARYEASYRTNGKAGSIPSTSSDTTLALTSAPATRTPGDLWNFVTQGDAATACYDLYTTVNSDLMNSYAWDTAIIYIQEMENTNYANKNRGSNTTLKNTGYTGDEKCKIFDMAANEYEWTTEYSAYTNGPEAHHCVYRGGAVNNSRNYTRNRYSAQATGSNRFLSFRSILYL